MHSPKYYEIYVPLALAAGRETVGAVARFLIKLRDVYQITHCTINTLQYKNYDMHEMHSKLSKLCIAWQFARNKLSQASQTILEINLRQK